MVIDPTATDLAMTILLFAVVVGFSIREGLGIERSLTVATIRTVVQLLFMGFVVKVLFGVNQWWVVLLALFVMMTYAASAGLSRMKDRMSGLFIPMWVGIVTGSVFTTAVVTGAVLKVEPWWRPEMLIPLGGMILGNAMNGGALAADRLYSEIKSRQNEIEMLLALGRDYKRAAHTAKKEAIRSALIPTINSMMTVGIVHLPGLMVGQLLGGVEPIVAAKYQIIIMLMVASSVTITAVVFTTLAMKNFFTKNQQLKRRVFD
ncbi:hypothetical protein MNBD_NITROSPINAE01-59 [hydrothermal vent metagenome]|uniref:Iron export permease protein FetB n=1 Tax=hydrothermal vent metagenome TaxID=652676 RepID=A0A3B1CKG9_9ZZZZ